MGSIVAKALIYALHGFLGRATDWEQVVTGASGFEFVCGEMFRPADFAIPDWSALSQKKIFVGYSLGGRLGLQFLQHSPHKFDHYVFLSTHPGFALTQAEERKKRLQDDQAWAAKISAANWDGFLKEWNSQSVFAGSAVEPNRSLPDFDLQKLRTSLIDNSLSKQPDYRKLISLCKNKITWVVGQRDSKYCELAESLDVKFVKVDSGHRILLDNPAAVVEILDNI